MWLLHHVHVTVAPHHCARGLLHQSSATGRLPRPKVQAVQHDTNNSVSRLSMSCLYLSQRVATWLQIVSCTCSLSLPCSSRCRQDTFLWHRRQLHNPVYSSGHWTCIPSIRTCQHISRITQCKYNRLCLPGIKCQYSTTTQATTPPPIHHTRCSHKGISTVATPLGCLHLVNAHLPGDNALQIASKTAEMSIQAEVSTLQAQRTCPKVSVLQHHHQHHQNQHYKQHSLSYLLLRTQHTSVPVAMTVLRTRCSHRVL